MGFEAEVLLCSTLLNLKVFHRAFSVSVASYLVLHYDSLRLLLAARVAVTSLVAGALVAGAGAIGVDRTRCRGAGLGAGAVSLADGLGEGLLSLGVPELVVDGVDVELLAAGAEAALALDVVQASIVRVAGESALVLVVAETVDTDAGVEAATLG